MQGGDSFRLVVRRGPQPNQTFELNKDIITLGRDITNDIVINDPECSRHHLRLTRGASGYNLEDLGSTNGTFVNGQRLTGVRPLNRGDMIGLGETVTLGYEMVRPGGEIVGTPPPAPPVGAPQAPYSPPAQSQQPGYAPPAYGAAPPAGEAEKAAYSQQPAYGQQPGYTQPDYGYGQPGYGQPSYAPQPPGAGYDYDPYAIREEEPRSAVRWILIGCGLLSVFCCCTSVVGLVIIDTLELWYDLPIIKELAPLFERIANALGLV